MARSDAQSQHYHEFTGNRQNWAIDRWCSGVKISRTKLEQHPYVRDLATMLMFDAWQQYMNQSDHDIWRHCWQSLYHKEIPLSLHQKRKLLNITDGLEYRQQAYRTRELKRQHIQARITRKQLATV